jgi:ribonuclease P protein component
MKNKNFVTLKKKKDFSNIISANNSAANSIYIFKYIKNDLNIFRYAISPNKKIFRTAVLRNKIKRQIRVFISKLNTYKSYDVIIVVKSNYLLNNFIQNSNSLLYLYNKL